LVSLGGRWKFWIWYHLFSGPKRFGELQRLLPQANRQTLTVQLRELEQMGVLGICADAPKVEYALTGLGQRSESMLFASFGFAVADAPFWLCQQLFHPLAMCTL